MKIQLATFLGTTLALFLQLPAIAISWKMLAECHFFNADGKQQAELEADTQQIEMRRG